MTSSSKEEFTCSAGRLRIRIIFLTSNAYCFGNAGISGATGFGLKNV